MTRRPLHPALWPALWPARWLALAIALAAWALPAPQASAQRLRDRSEIEQLDGVDLEEHVGTTIPLDIALTDASGKPVTLADYLSDDKPAVLALVYYDCPVVCTVVMDRLAESLNGLDYIAGRDFRVIVVSFDHTETTAQAQQHQLAYLSGYAHGATPETIAGWTFHTADADNARRLIQAVGWRIKLLDNGEYSHPVGLTVLGPGGLISRYLYGFEYPPKQMKLSLLEASDGKIARSLGERLMHFCYRYDPYAGRYSVQAMTIMQIGAGLTVAFLVVFIGTLLVRERHRRARRSGPMPSLARTPALGHRP